MKLASPSPRLLWCAMVLLAAGYIGVFVVFPGLFRYVGVNHFNVWFLDTFALLASNDAVARGLNPYDPNPLDYFLRAHVYSHWWLGLGPVGLGRKDILWLGLVQGFAFFAAAAAGLRPRSVRELGWCLLVLCSSPVLLTINRANNDLIVFLLLFPVVPCLLDHRRIVRLFPVFLVAVATGLKFYPAVAGLVLLAGVDAREARARLLVAILLLTAVGINLIPDFQRMGGLVPRADGLMTFGAVNLLQWLGLTGWKVGVAMAGFIFAVAVFFARRTSLRELEIPPEHQGDWLRFVVGAALLTGCFFAGTNYAYRWIFALWLAPLLWRLLHDGRVPAASRKFVRLTAILLVLVLWLDPVVAVLVHRVPGLNPRYWADLCFRLEQPVTWLFFACLLGWLVHFVRANLPRIFGAR